MSEKTYRIIQLETENVKRIKAVSITPDGNIVEITGKNGNGKSSVLDSIFWTLAGKDEIQSQPIRSGQEKAHAVVHLDGLTIRRNFEAQENGGYFSTLVVEADELGKVQAPQKVLDKLIGDLTFDPLEFTRMKPEAQFDLLKKFVPDFDFNAEAKTRKAAFDARTDVNRKIKELKSQVAGILVDEDVPAEEIDISALTDELQAVGDFNTKIEVRRGNRQSVSESISRLRFEAIELEKRAADLLKQAEQIAEQVRGKIAEATAEQKRLDDADPLPEQKDPAEIRTKIDEANVTNAAVRLRKQRDDLIKRAEAAQTEADQLTADIDASDVRKATAIKEAKMPVPGIDFGDGIVTLNGLPFDQASSAEQLRASVAMTMAANPKLRVILIRDGSLLDTDSMKILSDMADEHGFQCWIETVSSGRPGAVIIEDGMVKGDAALEAAE